jgi:hypothetical protein
VDEIEGRWAGTDLCPLPHESVVSTLWRFCWRNMLDAKQLKEICSGRKVFPARGFPEDPSCIDSRRFFAEMRWNLPSAEERAFWRESAFGSYIWMSAFFKYCPLCLEHGYHSYWHQLKQLESCPIHEIQLSQRCQACNRHVAVYRLSKELFQIPYCCTWCHQPISGVRPTLDGHMDFRESEKAVEGAFMPLVEWWNKNSKNRSYARAFSARGRYARDIVTWCDHDEFLRSIASLEECSLNYIRRPQYGRITKLAWRIKMQDTGVKYWWISRIDTGKLMCIARCVYRCTLHLLEKRILAEEGLSEDDYLLHKRRVFGVNKVPLHGCRPELLALCLMRSSFEMEWGFWQDGRFADLRSIPDFNFETYQSRVPRIAFRALFLAIYAAWYFEVKRLMSIGTLYCGNFVDGVTGCPSIFSNFSGSSEIVNQWRLGEVAFPAVDILTSIVHGPLTQRNIRTLSGDEHE